MISGGRPVVASLAILVVAFGFIFWKKKSLLFLLSYHIMLKQFACLFYWTCFLVCIPIEIQNNNLTWYPPTSKGKARKMIRFTKFRAPFLKGVRSNVPPVPILRSWKRVASFWNNTATRRIFQHFTESLETQIKPMKSPDKKRIPFLGRKLFTLKYYSKFCLLYQAMLS